MKYTTRQTCRVCGSKQLTQLFSLGSQYVSDFPRPKSPTQQNKVPIDLELCSNCKLVQAKHTAPQDFLYTRHYWYRSGVTETMRNHLQEIANTIETTVPLYANDIILDIGSNDGTLLRSFNSKKLKLVGVEPALNLVKEGSKGVHHFINDFWSYDTYWKTLHRQAKVITALGMFYDLEDPNQFIEDISKSLHPEGIFIAQLMCLQNMLELRDVGNFAHEHLEFYSLESLNYLYNKHGLEINRIEENNTNGRSYRIWASHTGQYPTSTNKLQTFYAKETDFGNIAFFKQFFNQLEKNKLDVVEFIEDVTSNGKTVWVYGASTKGNTILQYYGLDNSLIQGAAERSPEKYGRVTVGTNIPISSEKKAREAKPDYFLVLPYTFIDEFVQREKEFLSRGGHFIVPLPELRII
jgi:NDP-4-keto-2,6-dideoxyhexose 3-C-methyltransferase